MADVAADARSDARQVCQAVFAQLPPTVDGTRVRAAVSAAVAELVAQQSPTHPLRQAAVAVRAHRRARRRLVVRHDPDRPITTRQLEVLHLLAQGHTTEEPAKALHLGPDTVKTHLGRLYQRLGATGRAHAVAIGFRTGLLAWEASDA
jgi:DNA-binding CsgD family transcriptional regulator